MYKIGFLSILQKKVIEAIIVDLEEFKLLVQIHDSRKKSYKLLKTSIEWSYIDKSCESDLWAWKSV